HVQLADLGVQLVDLAARLHLRIIPGSAIESPYRLVRFVIVRSFSSGSGSLSN
ncbi:MAG: hypothetical protein HC855_09740, partial [Rhizobiales bacterium]|nr:hypothetical protein [Hyphomicrobiales bacterium]